MKIELDMEGTREKTNTFMLVGILVVSAYILQRSLLLLSGRLEVALESQQMSYSFAGMDLPLSYYTMNLFWPIILGLLIFGFKRSQVERNQDNEIGKLINNSIFYGFAVYIFPITVIALHVFYMSEFFLNDWELVTRPFAANGGGLGWDQIPAIQERVASIFYMISSVCSLLIFLLATFAAKKPIVKKVVVD